MSQDLYEATKAKPATRQRKLSTDRMKTMNVKPCKEVEALKAMLFHTPEMNQDRIEFIKGELSAGRYQIDSLAIANKLLENA